MFEIKSFVLREDATKEIIKEDGTMDLLSFVKIAKEDGTMNLLSYVRDEYKDLICYFDEKDIKW